MEQSCDLQIAGLFFILSFFCGTKRIFVLKIGEKICVYAFFIVPLQSQMTKW